MRPSDTILRWLELSTYETSWGNEVSCSEPWRNSIRPSYELKADLYSSYTGMWGAGSVAYRVFCTQLARMGFVSFQLRVGSARKMCFRGLRLIASMTPEQRYRVNAALGV